MDQDYSVTSNLNADYVFDGTYGPIPDENGFVDLTDYAKNYIADYKTVTEIPAKNMEYLNHCTPNNMTRTFAGLVKCSTIDVSGIDTSHVSSFSYCFDGSAPDTKSDNSILSKITGIENLDTSSATDMSYMFFTLYYYSDILDLSKWDVSNVLTMESMFENTGSHGINVSNWNTKSVTTMYAMFFGASGTSATSTHCICIGIENLDTSNCSNMSSMFSKSTIYSNLNNGIFDLSKWDVSKCTDLSSFCGNGRQDWTTGTTICGIENWDVSNVTDMRYMFSYLDNYRNRILSTALDLSKWDVSNVLTMKGMFQGCIFEYDFTLNLSNWNTSNVTDMSYFFGEFTQTAGNIVLDLSNWDTSKADCSLFFGSSNSGKEVSALDIKLTLDLTSTKNVFNLFSYLQKYSGTPINIKNPPQEYYNNKNYNNSGVIYDNEFSYNIGFERSTKPSGNVQSEGKYYVVV